MVPPREPPRCPPLGFLYLDPFRIQGLSIAGEETVVQVPELDLCFDIGRCPRTALTSNFVALSHGHMDHAAGLAYYYSQRNFQGMGTGTVICHPAIEQPIHNVMRAWIDLEAQRTPYNVVGLPPDGEVEIKNHVFVRGFATTHTVPSLGFVVVEKRSKLRPELAGLPQEKLLEIKGRGEPITQILEVPLVCYTGDTMWGPHFDRPDVLAARIMIVECTFLEPGHRDRAAIGQHLHLEDIATLLARSKAEAVVLTHLSRRTHANEVRRQIEEVIRPEDQERVYVLMNSRGPRSGRTDRRHEAEAPAGEPGGES
jgi:ribonuclease Z